MNLILNERKLLPDGIHNVDLGTVQDLFGTFQRTSRRTTLFAKLSQYVEEVQKADIAEAIIVDGSFIMGCIDEPDDIDVILVLKQQWDMTADLLPYQYNLVSKRDVKRNYPFDLIPVRSGSAEEKKWIDYFSQVNTKWYQPYDFPPGSTKGLVRIAL